MFIFLILIIAYYVVYYSINDVVVYLLYAQRRRKMTFLNKSLTAWRLCRFGSRQHLFFYECLACKKPLHSNGSWGLTWNFDVWTRQSINLIHFAWWFSILSFINSSQIWKWFSLPLLSLYGASVFKIDEGPQISCRLIFLSWSCSKWLIRHI